jgi:phage regulator Rha-like protein
MQSLVTAETIAHKIYLIRGQKVMLDSDLAELYGVTTGVLVQAVKRNIQRFPLDFMFLLKDQEVAVLRSQIVISSLRHGGRRYNPYAFTEQGVAMLSSVLNSERAVEVNIQIIRVFVKLREMIAAHKDLAKKLEELEKKYDAQFRVYPVRDYRLCTIPM